MRRAHQYWLLTLVLSVIGCNGDTVEAPTTPVLPITPKPAKIVFTRQDTPGIMSVWGMQPDGTGQFKLASEGNYPVWAPNGQYICVTQYGVDTARLFLISPDGSEIRELGTGDLPHWSPDGKKLALNREGNLYTLDVNTGQETMVGPSGLPVWSRVGEVIRILSNRCPGMDNCDLYISDVGSSEGRRILDGGVYLGFSSPSPLSPNGNNLLVTTCFDGAQRVKILDLRDMSIRLVASGARNASWSPDGSRIAYTMEFPRGDRVAGLYLFSVDDNEAVRIADGPYGAYSPSWSPEGGRVVFVLADETLSPWIFTVNTDGTGLAKLSTGSNPQWAPNRVGLL